MKSAPYQTGEDEAIVFLELIIFLFNTKMDGEVHAAVGKNNLFVFSVKTATRKRCHESFDFLRFKTMTKHLYLIL